jgi:hypothetical protein
MNIIIGHEGAALIFQVKIWQKFTNKRNPA